MLNCMMQVSCPNWIGIAIDLQAYWTGRGTDPKCFDNWGGMLNEQVGILEASSRKEGAARYRETIANDVKNGTARAFRFLRPVVA